MMNIIWLFLDIDLESGDSWPLKIFILVTGERQIVYFHFLCGTLCLIYHNYIKYIPKYYEIKRQVKNPEENSMKEMQAPFFT